MSSKNNKNKLKMERLSPIPALDRTHLPFDSLRTPLQPAAPPSHLRQKDGYAIEITSSPEFSQPPVVIDLSSLQKQRRTRNIARGKVPKKTNSTPLSGLITRKTVNAAPKGIHFSDPFSSPASTDAPSPHEGLLLSIPEEVPQIDEYSPQKPTHSPRHSEMISAAAIFPQKPQPGNSNTTPLAGIVNVDNKKSSNLSRSLNDSMLILRDAEDPSDDDEIASNTSLLPIPIHLPKSDAEKLSIESFESPRKPRYVLPKEHTTAASIFKKFHSDTSKNFIMYNLDKASPITGNSSTNNGEMCGHERKNRKRALDFHSIDFMVPTKPDDLGDGRQSPILSLTPFNRGLEADCQSTGLNLKSPSCDRSDRRSPVLSLKPKKSPLPSLMPPSHDKEGNPMSPAPNLNLDNEPDANCKSPILNVTPLQHEYEGDRQFPTFSFKYPSNDRDCRSPILNLKPTKLPILTLTPTRHDRENSQSPVLNLTLLDHEPQANCKSPILNLSPLQREPKGDRQSPTFSFKYPSNDRDCQSPILNLKPKKSPLLTLTPPRHDRENSHSPILNLKPTKAPILNLTPPRHDRGNHQSSVLNLTPLDHDPEPHRQSPILIFSSSQLVPEADRESPILSLPKPPKSANINSMSPFFCSSKTHFEPLKPTECPEIKPHIEKQDEECLSDNDSIIGSTPRSSENRNQNSGGFTASRCLQLENDSPSSVDYSAEEFDIPIIAGLLQDTAATKGNEQCDLKFVVVSHDTSSDEAMNDADGERVTENSGEGIFPVIDGRHSPLELNYTKRPIQSFESPSKASKPFSEAVNIGAFGSPDSNASYRDRQDEEDEEEADEVIEPSTTQEYIEESEQVRPTKRRKKGSLLERVKGVIAKVDASNALFDYEIKCGLRPSKGKFVSAPLVILKKSGESSSIFLVCTPLKYCGNPSHVEDISSYVIVHVNKLPSSACDGSVVLLHFPINVMYFSNLRMPCALAGHRIVLHPTEQKIDIRTIDSSSLDSINSFSLTYTKPMTSFKTFSSVQLRTLSEAALCQNLVEESNLYLTVLHVTKLHVKAILKKISVLCSDEESQFCWLEFSSERDIRRATALETLHILSDGSQVQAKGFSVTGRVRLDRKSKNLISYCFNNTVNDEIIFSAHPKESTWVISSTEGLSEVKKVRSSIGDILSKKMLGCRYLFEVHGVEKEPLIKLKDSQGQSIVFVIGENSHLNLDHPVPFFLDGSYFFDDKLFSDEHTRVIPII